MAEAASSTPAPAADPHSPDRSAAALWRRYKAARAALNELPCNVPDAVGEALDELHRAALTAPLAIGSAADGAAAAEMAVESLAIGRRSAHADVAGAERLEGWVKAGGAHAAHRPDRLTYIASLYARLVQDTNEVDERISTERHDGPAYLRDEYDFGQRWMDALEDEAPFLRPVTDEGAAFQAALIGVQVDRLTTDKASAELRAIGWMADALLDYLDPEKRLGARQHIATFIPRSHVEERIGGFGPDGRVRLADAA